TMLLVSTFGTVEVIWPTPIEKCSVTLFLCTILLQKLG
ncbi:MAG: hypothetical protein ACI8P9_005339, partial [Parasphingorhabdus sp.]